MWSVKDAANQSNRSKTKRCKAFVIMGVFYALGCGPSIAQIIVDGSSSGGCAGVGGVGNAQPVTGVGLHLVLMARPATIDIADIHAENGSVISGTISTMVCTPPVIGYSDLDKHKRGKKIQLKSPFIKNGAIDTVSFGVIQLRTDQCGTVTEEVSERYKRAIQYFCQIRE